MDGSLGGRVALITGASGGIGQALARRLAAGGAALGLGYSTNATAARALAAQITSAGGTALAIGADLRTETGMLPGDPAQLRQRVPVGRLGQPSEVADLAAAILANAY